MSGLTLPQRLGLVKYLETRLEALRKGDLLAQAQHEMPSGSRMPIMFGGRKAGFATMPEPSKRAAYVADPPKFLAWAKRNYPDKVLPVTEVAVDDDLIAFLADHYPQALRNSERVQQPWTSDICAALRDKGFYVTSTGEKLTEVPGIIVPDPDPPVPRVNLDKEHAGEVIAAAWQAGVISAADLLALPAPEGGTS